MLGALALGVLVVEETYFLVENPHSEDDFKVTCKAGYRVGSAQLGLAQAGSARFGSLPSRAKRLTHLSSFSSSSWLIWLASWLEKIIDSCHSEPPASKVYV